MDAIDLTKEPTCYLECLLITLRGALRVDEILRSNPYMGIEERKMTLRVSGGRYATIKQIEKILAERAIALQDDADAAMLEKNGL